jgi:hypothetical protein
METDRKNYTIEQSRKNIAKVARQILEGKIRIADGAREIESFRFSSHVEQDKDILFFSGIAGDTADFPFGEARKLWNPEALKIKDENLKIFEERFKDVVFEMCKNLISKYGAE